jgi:hypothetical protein
MIAEIDYGVILAPTEITTEQRRYTWHGFPIKMEWKRKDSGLNGTP